MALKDLATVPMPDTWYLISETYFHKQRVMNTHLWLPYFLQTKFVKILDKQITNTNFTFT